MTEFELVVVGGGPAGMAAALKARECGVKSIIILERAAALGGILRQCIHTGFGIHYFNEELTGPEYAGRFVSLLGQTDIAVKTDTMVIDISEDNVVTAVNGADGLLEIKAMAIVLAMGCRERPRGALSIAGSRPSGILTAGTAQRYVNTEGYMVGKEVVILGSGDIGLIMARRMTLEGAHVKMVCELMPYSSGLSRNIVQCLDDFDIPLRLSCTVVKTHGRERLEGVTVQNVDDRLQPVPDTEEFVPCDTLLLSVGLIPENELSKNAGIDIDPVTGGPVVSESRETSRRGIFACGNVLQVHDLVDFVTEESMTAGKGAAEYIFGDADNAPAYVSVKGEQGVRYVVPQKADIKANRDIRLYFRVSRVYENAVTVVTFDGKELLHKKKMKMTPGEMESVTVTKEMLEAMRPDGVLAVFVKEQEKRHE